MRAVDSCVTPLRGPGIAWEPRQLVNAAAMLEVGARVGSCIGQRLVLTYIKEMNGCSSNPDAYCTLVSAANDG